jgi:hypothetical protein
MVVLDRPNYGSPPARDFTLLRGQQNEVLRALKSAGLDPGQFKWEVVISPDQRDIEMVISKLTYPGGFFFLFASTMDSSLYFTRSPGLQTRQDYGHPGDWGNQFLALRLWADLLKREVSEPDLWGSLSSEQELVGAASGETENSPFAASEQKQIAKDVEEIRQFVIATCRLTEAQSEFVNERFTYLIEASERVGRKDWINLAVSVLISHVLALAMPPETTRELFRFSARVLHWLFKGQLFFPI